MTRQRLLEYCLMKQGAYLDHPFGPEFDVVKVRGKIFAQLFDLKGIPMLTVNGDAVTNDFWRVRYPTAVKRGWHCPPMSQPYFNTIDLSGQVPEDELLSMVDLSYRYVVGKLPKKVQKELLTPERL